LKPGYRLLRVPVGSQEFVLDFFTNKWQRYQPTLGAPLMGLQPPDKALALHPVYHPKVPHLMGAEVLHSLPLDFDASHWEECHGPLTFSTDNQISAFLKQSVGRNVPQSALVIGQNSVAHGGLGLLNVNASSRSILGCLLTMMMAMHHNSQDFLINPYLINSSFQLMKNN